MTAAALVGLLALAGCTNQAEPTASAPPLGDKAGLTVSLEELPTIEGETDQIPQIAFPLKEGATSPSPTPTDEAPEDNPEAPEDNPEATATPEPSPYIDPPATLQVWVVGDEGTGDVVQAEDIVSVSLIAWQWGKIESLTSVNSYLIPDPFVFSLQSEAALGVLSRIVVGQQMGSRVAAVVPPAMGDLNVALGGEAGSNTVVMMDLREKWPQASEAQSDAVPTGEVTGPVISGQLGQEATVTVPGGTATPEQFTVQIIATGSGPEAAVGDTVLIHYAAVEWTGADAGSTWQVGSGPIAVLVPEDTLEQITAFAALVGVPVGSRILVSLPAKEQAYPASAVVIDVVALVKPLPWAAEMAADTGSPEIELDLGDLVIPEE